MADAIPVSRLHARVKAWLEREGKADETWAVAVSGGADSVALLLLLWAHFPKRRTKILVLHFDHGLRPDSAADGKFVEQLAAELGVGFATARRAPGGSMNEAALRDVRMKFFHAQLAAHGARVIFFGHQLEDIAETMLIRLARGSGASGLSAPRPARSFPNGIVALRPLLELKREELRCALRAAGVDWREDSSNAQGHYLRNRLRLQVLPVWRAAENSRDIEAGAARARAALEDDADALENITAELMGDLPAGEPLRLDRLSGQPRAIIRRALYWWLERNRLNDNLNATAFDTLLEAVSGAQPGRWSAGPGRWLALNQSALTLEEGAVPAVPWLPQTMDAGAAAALPGGARLETRIIAVTGKLLKDLKAGRISPSWQVCLALPGKSAAKTKLIIRPWRPGDRYRPLGGPGRAKLQDLFTDKKIPVKERHRIPVVCSEDNEPLWVPGLPPAHARRLTAATHLALELTFKPASRIIDSLST